MSDKYTTEDCKEILDKWLSDNEYKDGLGKWKRITKEKAKWTRTMDTNIFK